MKRGGPCILYLSTVELPASTTSPVSLWPKEWVEQRGGRLCPKPGAPRAAKILPLSVSGAASTFLLRTVPKGLSTAPFETVEPDMQDTAYVLRWMGAELAVGADLFAFNTSAAGPTTISVMYFFR